MFGKNKITGMILSRQPIASMAVVFLVFFIIIANNIFVHDEASSDFVIRSLIQGNINLNNLTHLKEYCDFSIFQENVYSPFGIGFYLTLIPFWLIFPPIIFQGTAAICFLILALIALYKITRKIGLDENQSLWLLFFLISGTVVLPLAAMANSIPPFAIQVIGFGYLTFSLAEYFHKKRFWLIGIFLTLAFLSRSTLILASIFFILQILLEKNSTKQKIKNLFLFGFPILIGLIIFGYYNLIRFDSIFETGYQYQNVIKQNYGDAKLLGLKNIFNNLYYFLITPPTWLNGFPWFRPDGKGTGLIFMSPFLFLALLAPLKNKNIWTSWITILIMSIIPLMWLDSGQWQIGYRLAFDFYPFLFLIIFYFIEKNKLNKPSVAVLIYGSIATIALFLNDLIFEIQLTMGLR